MKKEHSKLCPVSAGYTDCHCSGKLAPVIKESLKGEKSHEQKTVEFYAHDYRDMPLFEDDLINMLEGFAEALNCKHECTSNCRRNGCNCACGEYHF